MQPSFATALATMRQIVDYTSGEFAALGVSEDDLELTHGEMMWQRQHVHTVLKTLNSLMFGTLEIMGMPKINIPAEFQAALIATFVAPVNRIGCCILFEQENKIGGVASEIANNAENFGVDRVARDQLFALVLELSSRDESTQARLDFKERLGLRADKLLKTGKK